jgi:DNA-binding response OmpR family regulator
MLSLTTILYAEDDSNDAFLMERAFEKVGMNSPLRIVGDGQLAIAYLSGSPPFENRALNPMPGLLLLDLKMPRKSGLEVLQWVRSTALVSTLPVLMLTSSSQDSDIRRAYELGANGYLVKPGNPRNLFAMVEAIRAFWLEQNQPNLVRSVE